MARKKVINRTCRGGALYLADLPPATTVAEVIKMMTEKGFTVAILPPDLQPDALEELDDPPAGVVGEEEQKVEFIDPGDVG